MRLAFLADIHGNLPALEAVAADLAVLAPDAVYLLGDQINRCPWNNEVMDMVAERSWPAIMGNHELVIGRLGTPTNRPPFTERARFPTLWWTWEHLGAGHLATVRTLPDQLRLSFSGAPPILLIHGVPENPFAGIYPSMADAHIQALLADISEPVVVSGHSHRPMVRRVGARQVLNGGSVGMPYNGDTAAQFLILDLVRERSSASWRPRLCRAEYDHTDIPRAFARSGMLQATGPIGRLNLQTVLDGQPWISDFGQWLKIQPAPSRSDLHRAVAQYLATHGPGNWSFDEQ